MIQLTGLFLVLISVKLMAAITKPALVA